MADKPAYYTSSSDLQASFDTCRYRSVLQQSSHLYIYKTDEAPVYSSESHCKYWSFNTFYCFKFQIGKKKQPSFQFIRIWIPDWNMTWSNFATTIKNALPMPTISYSSDTIHRICECHHTMTMSLQQATAHLAARLVLTGLTQLPHTKLQQIYKAEQRMVSGSQVLTRTMEK